MPGLPITITDAGRAALINAQNTGTVALTISQVGVSATHTAGALAGLAALPGELKRLVTFGGAVVADDTLHLTIRDESTDNYSLRAFGLYLSNGVLFAVYSQAAPVLEKSAGAMVLLATDIVLASLTTANIEFGDTNFINPPATVQTPGVIEIADQAEVDAGVRNDVAVPPGRLRALLNTLLGAKANAAHTHDAADVVSGIFSALRIPDLAMAKITGLAAALAGKADADHTHNAGAITSGELSVLRIPDLAMSKITGLAAALAVKLDAANFTWANLAGKPNVAINGADASFGILTATQAISAPTVRAIAGGVGRAMLYIGDETRSGYASFQDNAGAERGYIGWRVDVAGVPHNVIGGAWPWNFLTRPKFDGATPWDSANFDPATKAASIHSHDWAQITGKPRLALLDGSDRLIMPIYMSDPSYVVNGAPGYGMGMAADSVVQVSGYYGVRLTGLATDLLVGQNGNISLTHRPTFAGNTPWDSGNFSPADKLDAANFTWANLPGKPATFPAAPHTHPWGDVTGAQASAAEFRSNAGDKAITPATAWAAAQIVVAAQAATISIDLSTGFNFSTVMTGNRTLGAPSNAKPGQSGVITFTQDGTGGRTLAFDPAWKFASGIDPVLSTAAGARDILCFTVIAPGDVVASLIKDVK